MAKPLGLILSGGRSSRMGGGDKALKVIAGETILSRVIARFSSKCSPSIISANGDPARFAAYSLPIVADSVTDFAGPLAGVLAGLDWAAAHAPETKDIVTLPADCPFLPADLIDRLAAVRSTANLPLVAAATGGRLHPVVGLWPVSTREILRKALLDGERKMQALMPQIGLAQAEWPVEPYDPFFNANTPEDIVIAEKIARLWPEA